MKYIIKRTNGGRFSLYLMDNGFYSENLENARRFETEQQASDYLEDEKSDPQYDKPYMSEIQFFIEGVE